MSTEKRRSQSKQPAPVKAWAVVGEDGEIDPYFLYPTRKMARDVIWRDDKIRRVLITPLESGEKK